MKVLSERVSLKYYIETGASKISFIDGANFYSSDSFNCNDLSWITLFRDHKAARFFVANDLWSMPDHQKFDLLFALWRALAVGGTLRVVEPQRMGSSAGGDAFLALDELIELLAAIGFSVRPAQYLDRQGVIAGDRVIDADLGALRDGGSPTTRAAWDGGRCMILDCVKTTETASNSGNFGRNKYFFIGDRAPRTTTFRQRPRVNFAAEAASAP